MNKVLVQLIIPKIGYKYDIFIPLNRRISNVIKLLVKAVKELTNDEYELEEIPSLYDRRTGKAYDVNSTVGEAGIKNGMELILI